MQAPDRRARLAVDRDDLAHTAATGAMIGWASLALIAAATVLPHRHVDEMSHPALLWLSAGAAIVNGAALLLARRGRGSGPRWRLLWAWTLSLLVFLGVVTYAGGGFTTDVYVLSFPAVVFAGTLLPPAGGVAAGLIAAAVHLAAVLTVPERVLTGELVVRLGALVATGVVAAELAARARREAARRAATEAERDLRSALLQELHHRVKNDLQTVAELLSLEVNRDPSQSASEVAHRTVARIQSIAGVHDLVALHPGTTLSGDVARRVAGFLRDRQLGEGVSLSVVGDGVTLDVEQATCFALAVNELVTNALTHAFPGGRRGSVTVELRPGDGSTEVTVTDNGAGFRPGREDGEALGLEIVRRVVSQGLGGTFTIGPGAPGTVATIRFPVAGPHPNAGR
ncbi:MAG: sensor histidine kinase [Actinobacteria bacterium]|nr:sensor histidine kinase [Actinomycetota bacterium]